ncbi:MULTISPECIES: type III secretion system export apparatus subunit SctS [unclassified Caballeronia]|uniref:type III secretion system export apparatus subunit SctS n=1 Tax=unclassified Caballeronia TaxID=2646786 RepID=UPI0020290245|nr:MULTISPECIES: type III secretion system export apparatus subunit SctS [unclassified Caballeronia]
MSHDTLVQIMTQGLLLCVTLSLPAVAVAALTGMLVGFLQAIFSMQDQTFSHGVKLAAVTLTLVITGPWAGSSLIRFVERSFQIAFGY